MWFANIDIKSKRSESNICVTFPWFCRFPAKIIDFKLVFLKKQQKQAFTLLEDKNIWITSANVWQFTVSAGSSQQCSTFLPLPLFVGGWSTSSNGPGRQPLRQKNLFGFRLPALRHHRSAADKVHVTVWTAGIHQSNHSLFWNVCRPAVQWQTRIAQY